ncbi:MAG: response regulator [Planctomycetota bacterium]|jgi:DNA-binding NtrC family response regulator
MSDNAEYWLMVLDDDPIVTRSIEALLKAESPWNVATFNRPSAALAALDERTYHAVISDFLMPEMDGIHFLKQVRALQPSASRILLTGYADKRNAIRSINEAGLYHYIEKPWDNDALMIVLRNALERASLIQQLDERMKRLAETDRSLEEMRARLLKAIL